MADLRDSLLRAIQAEVDAGRGLALVAAGSPWRCCDAARAKGPGACTCWQPIYDRDQTDPDLDTVVAAALGTHQLQARHRMCGDCAYRPGSPEKSGDAGVAGDTQLLERLAARGERFWCHDGMRSPVAWRHPAGMKISAVGTGDYQPPIYDGVPYRADGQPGLLCAGWAARNRALATKEDS